MMTNRTALGLRKLLVFSLTLLTVAALNGCQGLVGISQPPPSDNPALDAAINHIVIMVQENRSFDHYFGHLNAYRVANGFPGDVDGTPANASNPSTAGPVPAFHLLPVAWRTPVPRGMKAMWTSTGKTPRPMTPPWTDSCRPRPKMPRPCTITMSRGGG